MKQLYIYILIYILKQYKSKLYECFTLSFSTKDFYICNHNRSKFLRKINKLFLQLGTKICIASFQYLRHIFVSLQIKLEKTCVNRGIYLSQSYSSMNKTKSFYPNTLLKIQQIIEVIGHQQNPCKQKEDMQADTSNYSGSNNKLCFHCMYQCLIPYCRNEM